MSLKSCKFLWAAARICKQLEPYVFIYVKSFYTLYFIFEVHVTVYYKSIVIRNKC